jgi:hypothetical protein
VAAAVSHAPNNKPRKAAVTVPLPIPGLVFRDVMEMEMSKKNVILNVS